MHHDHHRSVGAGHCPRDRDRVIVGQNFDNLEVEHGGGLVSKLTRHPQALAYASRIGTIPDRTAVTEILVGAARTGKSREVMAPDHARVATALGHALHVDLFAGLEYLAHRDRLAEHQFTLAAFLKFRGFEADRDLRLVKV